MSIFTHDELKILAQNAQKSQNEDNGFWVDVVGDALSEKGTDDGCIFEYSTPLRPELDSGGIVVFTRHEQHHLSSVEDYLGIRAAFIRHKHGEIEELSGGNPLLLRRLREGLKYELA